MQNYVNDGDDIYLDMSNEPKFNYTQKSTTQGGHPDVSNTNLSSSTSITSGKAAETTDGVNATAVAGGNYAKSGSGGIAKVMPDPMPSYQGGGMVY